jgi:hypothetical protein
MYIFIYIYTYKCSRRIYTYFSILSSLHSFVRSFVPSFLRSFVPSFLRSFVPSFLRHTHTHTRTHTKQHTHTHTPHIHIHRRERLYILICRVSGPCLAASVEYGHKGRSMSFSHGVPLAASPTEQRLPRPPHYTSPLELRPDSARAPAGQPLAARAPACARHRPPRVPQELSPQAAEALLGPEAPLPLHQRPPRQREREQHCGEPVRGVPRDGAEGRGRGGAPPPLTLALPCRFPCVAESPGGRDHRAKRLPMAVVSAGEL